MSTQQPTPALYRLKQASAWLLICLLEFLLDRMEAVLIVTDALALFVGLARIDWSDADRPLLWRPRLVLVLGTVVDAVASILLAFCVVHDVLARHWWAFSWELLLLAFFVLASRHDFRRRMQAVRDTRVGEGA